MKAATLLSSWENPQDVSRANLVFENRNKNYGGYFIRVYYPDRILRAFLFAVFGIVLLVNTPLLLEKFFSKSLPQATPGRREVIIDVVLPPVYATPIIPPETKAKVEKQNGSSEKFTQIKVVSNTIKTDEVKTQTELIKVNVDLTTNKSTDSVKTENKIETKTGNEKPVTVADVMPIFQGGDSKLFEYLRNNIIYPAAARQNNTQGYVYVTFVVDKTGKIGDVKLLRDIGDGCGEEAVRIIRKMPDWIPGKLRGEAIAFQYNLPINFRLK